MMQKIVRYEVDDIIVNPDGVVEALNHACTGRTGMYKIRGLCQVGGSVYFILLPLDPHETAETYGLAPVADISADGFTSMLHSRWSAGFDAVGSVVLGDTVYVLFARPQAQ